MMDKTHLRSGHKETKRGSKKQNNVQLSDKYKSPYKKFGDKRYNYQQKAGAKKRKFVLDFNEDDRNSFLTGFQKRKQERKARAKKELEDKAKEQIKRIRDEKNEKIREFQEANVVLDLEEENAEYTMNYDLEEQTVSISGFDMGKITNSLGTTIGARQFCVMKDKDEDKDKDKDDDNDNDNEQKLKQNKKSKQKSKQRQKLKC